MQAQIQMECSPLLCSLEATNWSSGLLIHIVFIENLKENKNHSKSLPQ